MKGSRAGLAIAGIILLAGCSDAPSVGCALRDSSFFADSLLREGDLVFRRGTGMVSRAVLMADKGGIYSHIGLVVRDSGKWKVIHAVPGEPDFPGDPDRIKKEPLETFFSAKRAKSGAVMRIEGSPEAIGQSIRKAEGFYRGGTLFDHAYDLSDTSRMYCTELIQTVFREAGIDLSAGKLSRINLPGFKGDYILPGDLQNSPYVKLIYEF